MKNIKRGNGEGSWTKLATNKWKVIITVGVDINGKQKRRSKTGTKQECLEWLKKNKAASCDDYFYDYAMKWVELVKNSVAKSTTNNRKQHIKVITKLCNFKMKSINSAIITDIINFASKYSDSYSGGLLGTLRSVLKYAYYQGDIQKMPIIKNNKNQTYISKEKYVPSIEEIKHLLFASKWDKNKSIYIILLLGFFAGMRIGEIIALKKDDIDLDTNTIKVYKTASRDENGKCCISNSTKTKSSTRKIYVSPIVINEIYNRFEGDLLVRNKNGSDMTIDSATSIISRFFTRMGLKKASAHSCRHAFITLTQQYGVNPIFIAKYVGHKLGNTTLDIYTHCETDKPNKELNDFTESFFK